MNISVQDMLDSIELFYPHISREIWNKWDNSEEFYKYMDELIFQSRPRLREGFPFYVFNTLIALVDIHRELYDVIKFDLEN